MYKLIRPLLFLINPESAHHLIFKCLAIARYIPFSGCIMRLFCCYNKPSLEREVFGLKFPNPVGLAAGLDKNATSYNSLANLGFGFVEIGSVTPKPQEGNPKPRCFRLVKDKAILNHMGINNEGVKQVVRNLKQDRPRILIGGNISKNATTPNDQAHLDYEKAFAHLYDYVDYFVINVSCPNVKGLQSLQAIDSLSVIVRKLVEIRRYCDIYRPILLKISPDLSIEMLNQVVELVQISGLDGIIACNTTTSREGLLTPVEKVKSMGDGGISGAPLKEKTLATIRAIREKTEGNLPIIGVGGIMCPQDAKDMLDAGASLVQIYTGFIYEGPTFVRQILKKL